MAHDASLLAQTKQGPFVLESIGQDQREIAHAAQNLGCKSDVVVLSQALLPSPFDRWVRMTYHIRPGIENGLLEVWADGALIAAAAGRIGYRDNVAGNQYFKFGPYGDPAPYDLKAYIARYRRGPTCAGLGNLSAPECR